MNEEIPNTNTNENAVETTVSALDKLTSWQREKFIQGCEKTLKKFASPYRAQRHKFSLKKLWLLCKGNRHDYTSDGRVLLWKRLPDDAPDGDWQCYGDRFSGGYEKNTVQVRPLVMDYAMKYSKTPAKGWLRFDRFDIARKWIETHKAELALAGDRDCICELVIGETKGCVGLNYLANVFRWIDENAGGKKGYGRVEFRFDSKDATALMVRLYQNQVKDGEEVENVHVAGAVLMGRRMVKDICFTLSIGDDGFHSTIGLHRNEGWKMKELLKNFYSQLVFCAKSGFENSNLLNPLEMSLVQMHWAADEISEETDKCLQVLRDRDLQYAINRKAEIKAEEETEKTSQDDASDTDDAQ